MREFKFRAWDGQSMTDEIAIAGNGHITTWDKEALLVPKLQSVVWPVMQYTGLKDKNGVEIYEGDILHCHEYDSRDTEHRIVQTFKNAVVGFYKGSFFYYPKGNMQQPHQHLVHAYKPEIIGNIHQHPHLLK